MHRSRQHRGSRRLVRVGFKAHAQFAQKLFGISQHIHQMADWRALIAAHIAHAVFQQGLGDGQDAFAGKCIARA